MTPDQQTRIESVIRSLSDIVFPAIREGERLAIEQLQLAIGHLGILHNELPATADFLENEMINRVNLSDELLRLTSEETSLEDDRRNLAEITQSEGASVTDISKQIQTLITAVYDRASTDCQEAVFNFVLSTEEAKAEVDRRWFSPMGFDSEIDTKA